MKRACAGMALLAAMAGCGKGGASHGGGQASDSKAGGGGGEAEPAKPTKPLEVVWKNDYGTQKGAITGGGSIETSGFAGAYHISIQDLPDGAGTWKLGDKSGKLSDVYTLLDVPVMDTLADRSWEELKSVDPKTELELNLKDGRGGKVALPPIDVTYMLGEKLKDVEHAPVLFGKEPDDPNKSDSLFWPESLDKKWIGKSGKLYELDWVLIVHKLDEEKGSRNCGGYTDSAGKPAPDIKLVFKETEATIYDRRTGAVVEKKVFGPDKECPMMTFHNADENSEDSSTPYDKIEGWARGRIKR